MQELSARKGFTLVEFFLVVMLLFVVGAVLLYGSGFFQKKVRNTERQELVKKIVFALEQYKGNNWHYPIAGDPIAGGAVVSSNNDFSSMMAVLGQSRFLETNEALDPAYGALFGGFNGVDAYEPGPKFGVKVGVCKGQSVVSLTDSTGEVSYSYYSIDGESYALCLDIEGGGVLTSVGPSSSLGI